MITRRSCAAALAVLISAPDLSHGMAGAEATPEDVVLALASGKTVLVEFYGANCASCAIQSRVIATLQGNSPHVAEAVTFLSVDFDAHSESELSKALEITESGTLVVLKHGSEYGRLVGETSTEAIRALVETAYRTATA